MAFKFNRIPTGDVLVDQNLQRLEQLISTIPSSTGPNVVSVSGDYSVKGTEDVIHVDSSRGPVTVTMLRPSSANRPLEIKQTNLQNGKSKVNPVTVRSPDGSKTIAGASSYILDSTGTGSASFTSDNQQHWPSAGSGGNPAVLPASPPAAPFIPPAPPPPVPPSPTTPWVAPVPYGTDNTFISNNLGTEQWAAECMVDFTGAPGSLTAYLWFEDVVTGGTGIVNVRIGGSGNKAIDGAIGATWSETATRPTARSVPTPIVAPSGLQRVTLTTQCTSGQKLTVSAVNLLFR